MGDEISWHAPDKLCIFNQFCHVFEHCGPIVPLPQCFSYQGPSFDVVATYALVYFPEYVVGVFLSYALKNGRREASFIKVPR